MDHPINDGFAHSVRPDQGYFHRPTAPGLGVTFEEDLLTRYPYAPGPNAMVSISEKDLPLSLGHPTRMDTAAAKASESSSPDLLTVAGNQPKGRSQ
jgi:hypothetical protein